MKKKRKYQFCNIHDQRFNIGLKECPICAGERMLENRKAKRKKSGVIYYVKDEKKKKRKLKRRQ